MPAGVTFRLVRAMVFAVVCCGLGALAHLLGGGRVPAPAAAMAFAISFAAAVPVTGRERGTKAILPLLAGAQVVLHLLFSTAPVVVPGGHPHSGLVPDVGMLVAHGLATVMTALWLARGEAALWALLRRLGVRFRLLMCAPHRTPYGTAAVQAVEPAPLRAALLEHSLSGRGPPRFAAA
ncbi:MFS transporter [Nonomuraea sp. NPDC050153]|uniref:MFS transporter n=1 Tax=Nonomuraea sp. NPDC050153 TaxID=3364359 RepID=UPI00379710C0